MRWQKGCDDSGAAFQVDDSLAGLTSTSYTTATVNEQLKALLSLDLIFPAALAEDVRFTGVLQRWLNILANKGALGALNELEAA